MKYVVAEVVLPANPDDNANITELASFDTMEEAERYEKGISLN